MKHKFFNFKIALIVLALTSASVSVWAVRNHYSAIKTNPVVPTKQDIPTEIVYDKVLLEKLQKIATNYDKIKKSSTVEGYITISDGADSTANMNHVAFVYCVKGNDLYYKLGQTEVLNTGGIYLYIDHNNKQVALSQQKQLVFNTPVSSLSSIVASMRAENYQLLSKKIDGLQTLTLSNEHHISCKQYTLYYDTVKFQIKRLYAQCPNINSPADISKDKITDARITRWDDRVSIADYLRSDQVVSQRGKSWQLTDRYKNYQLIMM